MKVLFNNRLFLFYFAIFVLYCLVCIFQITGWLNFDYQQIVGPSFAPPSGEVLMGTDFLGRSVFYKVLSGVKIAMIVGTFSVCIALLLGVFLGVLAGHYGGLVDDFIVWVYTTVSSIPHIVLILAISLLLGKGVFAICIAMGLTGWVHFCRLTRAEVLKHKNREYVLSATALGMGSWRKIFFHLLPNIFPILLVQISLYFQYAIKAEVVLSYLGIGVQGVPSWGTMIDDAKVELIRHPVVWWQAVFASLAMFVIVLVLNNLGDILRDHLDPKLRGEGHQKYER